MSRRPAPVVSHAEIRLLAAVAGIVVPEPRLAALATGLQAIRDDISLFRTLPLRGCEPAATFRPTQDRG